MKELKLLFSLIFVVLQYCIIDGAVINFVPVLSPNCAEGSEYGGGVGYSIHVGDCFTIDGRASYQYTESNGIYTLKEYAISKNGLADCQGKPKSSDEVIEGCASSPGFNSYFDSLLGSSMNLSIIKDSYRFPTIDDLPSTVSSFINSYSYYGCGVPFALEYLISGTPVTDAYFETVYDCINQNPVIYKCLNPQDSSVEQPNSSSASSSLEGLNCTEPYAYQSKCYEIASGSYTISYCYDPNL
ncbi:hypothetical protein ACTFIY_002872 [Dictyostelium cf. discoideum]